MKNKLFLLIFFTVSNYIFSQVNNKKCITTNLVKIELSQNPEYVEGRVQAINNNNKWINNNVKNSNTITIPTVVHIIHRNTHPNIGSGTNISNDQIEDALRVLNEDYSKTNPEFPNPPRNIFLNYAGNANLQFCLATIDPSGNQTNGITRTSTTRTNWDADDNNEANYMKLSSQGGIDGWDPSKYLNIWVCDLTNSQGNGMTLGYAYLPGLQSWNAWKDGLVIDYRYFGTNGVAAPSSDGRTATHEIGHYLGLMHTFCEDTDSQGNSICCDNDNTFWGNSIEDTPPTDGVYWGPVSISSPSTSSGSYNSCNDISYGFNSDLPDMHENFMSYATNTWMFSNDQINTMLATLNGSRLSLRNSNITTNCGSISSIENIIPEYKIYPNPSLGIINIDISEKIKTVEISNIIGKHFLIEQINNKINLNHLENGVYFITIKTWEREYTDKIILAR